MKISGILNRTTNNMNALAKHSKACGLKCLGPLTFHPGAVGGKITLSHGNCRASRELETFKDGLVFSSRPVKTREKVQFRVERSLVAWVGALRVGFTNVCPTTRPLPPLAIPDLTEKPGYWALPVPHRDCLPGTTVTFWMDPTGQLCFKTSTGIYNYTQTDLDLTQPLWAIIDVYGQSTTVLLLGSFNRSGLFIRTSCPVPCSTFECGYEDTPPELRKKIEMAQRKLNHCQEAHHSDNNPQTTACRQEDICSVCLDHEACVLLRCGHRCMCLPCANRVIADLNMSSVSKKYLGDSMYTMKCC